MEITLQRLAPHAKEYETIGQLYQRAFPKDERAPFSLLERKAAQGKGVMLVAKDGETLVGFAYVIYDAELAYLFYFAVEDAARGQGYGTAILKALQKEFAGKRLFLAREQLDPHADNYEQRVKRRNFYLHAGFEDQPSRIKEASVVYDVMSMGGAIKPEEYERLMVAWGGWLRCRLYGMRLMV